MLSIRSERSSPLSLDLTSAIVSSLTGSLALRFDRFLFREATSIRMRQTMIDVERSATPPEGVVALAMFRAVKSDCRLLLGGLRVGPGPLVMGKHAWRG